MYNLIEIVAGKFLRAYRCGGAMYEATNLLRNAIRINQNAIEL